MQKMALIVFAMAIMLRPVFPVVEYIVNYDYITSELCINKDKKNLHCNGKCHLKTQLAAAADTTDNRAPEKAKSQLSEVLFCIEIVSLLPSTVLNPVAHDGLPVFNLYSYLTERQIFHPPL